MQYKALPAPPAELDDPGDALAAGDPGGALAALDPVRDALPRVPRPESDCCARIADRVAWVADRDAAREWLVLLRALDLADRTADGSYVRADASVEEGTGALDRLADRFAERILGADAVLAALEDAGAAADASESAAIDADDALAALEPEVPEWERRRSDDWRARWREHAARLLDWWVLLGAARKTEDGYVAAERE